jgi:hypothetical protein
VGGHGSHQADSLNSHDHTQATSDAYAISHVAYPRPGGVHVREARPAQGLEAPPGQSQLSSHGLPIDMSSEQITSAVTGKNYTSRGAHGRFPSPTVPATLVLKIPSGSRCSTPVLLCQALVPCPLLAPPLRLRLGSSPLHHCSATWMSPRLPLQVYQAAAPWAPTRWPMPTCPPHPPPPPPRPSLYRAPWSYCHWDTRHLRLRYHPRRPLAWV